MDFSSWTTERPTALAVGGVLPRRLQAAGDPDWRAIGPGTGYSPSLATVK